MPGTSTLQATTSLEAEVTHISAHGLWMLIDGVEHFLGYERFPWFRNATVAQLLAFERPQPWHFWWPELDVDVHLDSLFHPERYPLTAKIAQPRVST